MKLRWGLMVLGLAAGVGSAQVKKPAARKPVSAVKPDGPTVLIDTTMGRLTCRLFSKQAPVTVANFVGLAEGSKDWTDGSTGAVVKGKPFYDGAAIVGVTDGISSGDRVGGGKGFAGQPFVGDANVVGFDRPGVVMMKYEPAAPGAAKDAPKLTSSSTFAVLGHADLEYEKQGTVFGQCDEASVAVVDAISHKLLSVENHPAEAVGIDHIAVLKDGEAMPAVAAHVAAKDIVPQPVPALASPVPAPEPMGPTATIETSMGTMTCKLFKDEAPIGVANFIGLATGTKDFHMGEKGPLVKGKHFYDGLHFARVIPDFMVQNADGPNDPHGDGDIGFHFDNEVFPGLTFDRPGRLAYANAGPNTNESEFFVTEVAVHRLDGRFTIFGQCDDASVDIVKAIARVPRDAHNKPLTPVTIHHITISGR